MRTRRVELWPKKRFVYVAAIAAVLVGSISFQVPTAKAANFSMQSGYYVGTGVAGKQITGLGFQPQLVLIKATTIAGVMVFKNSAMSANATAYMSATADNTASSITFSADGFTLGTLANVNSTNVLYTWTAFAGSDCTASGSFCVGLFSGNGAASRTITTGFQPNIVIVKRSTAVGAHFRTASMPTNRSEFFTSTAANTTGSYIALLTATGFTVGATDNANLAAYYYIAFKADPAISAEGTYVGTGLDNTNIAGLNFQPDFVLVKNSSSATANNRRAVMTQEYHHGDLASYVGDAVAGSANFIQALQSNGFQVGSGVATNETAATHYWFALGGTLGLPPASGTFSMATGIYTGNGTTQSITGLSFSPDLVLVKDNAANFAVFRTSQMSGDITAYLANAVADFAGGITALNATGFTVGSSLNTNSSGNTYQWQAFGNAYNQNTNSGAADFAVGTYYGNGIDNRNISAMPFQADFVVAKRNSTSAAAFKTSSQTGDLSGNFIAAAELADVFQAFSTTGFQVGANALSNTSASLYRWFAFKEGTSFDVGSYTGNGVDNTAITTVGFNPNFAMIKRSTAVAGVLKPSTLAGDSTQFFLNTANGAGRIKSLTSQGFTLGNTTEVNASGGTYRYAAWRIAPAGILSFDIVDADGNSVPSPSFAMNAISYPFDCSQTAGILGTTSQRLRLSNLSGNGAWTVSIAATDGQSALWRNGGNTMQYDFNDPTGSPLGCSDGADADTKAGKLRIEPSNATLTPQAGCATTNISLGTDTDFTQGSIDVITLASASSLAATGCYWDVTGIYLRQYIPPQQPGDAYNLNLTITSVAS